LSTAEPLRWDTPRVLQFNSLFQRIYRITVHEAITGYPDKNHPFYRSKFDDVSQDIIHKIGEFL